MVTRNGNGPFDLDYNLEIIKAPDEYWNDLRQLKNTVRILLDKAEGLTCFSESQDSTSCLTALLHFKDEPAVELVIQKDLMRDFMYGVKSIGREVSEQLINDDNLPHIQHSMTYEPYTYFFDGRVGYDVQYMDQDELIADMLKHYERYLSLLDDVGQELMAHEQTELAE